jgi:demethylmenaquinone methyltransferase/2-methoxy-6-polyprenyl-1,4-benzoquinol methylase
MTPTLGARPAAESTEAAAAEHVRELFSSIAPTYDLLNHLLSFGLDRRWWHRSALTFREVLARPDARILDLCCGTGDMTAALLALRPTAGSQSKHPSNPVISTGAQRSGETCSSDYQESGCPIHDDGLIDVTAPTEPEPITGLDFSAQMLTLARAKYPTPQIHWVEGDAMHLPYPDNTFDLITAAFGFRNLTNYAAGLAEIHRVLRPGGQIGILEANQPGGLSGALYTLYFRHILPVIGGLLSGDRPAYKYLPASVARFPRPPRMLQLMQDAGFANSTWDGYLLRAAGLYRGVKR